MARTKQTARGSKGGRPWEAPPSPSPPPPKKRKIHDGTPDARASNLLHNFANRRTALAAVKLLRDEAVKLLDRVEYYERVGDSEMEVLTPNPNCEDLVASFDSLISELCIIPVDVSIEADGGSGDAVQGLLATLEGYTEDRPGRSLFNLICQLKEMLEAEDIIDAPDPAPEWYSCAHEDHTEEVKSILRGCVALKTNTSILLTGKFQDVHKWAHKDIHNPGISWLFNWDVHKWVHDNGPRMGQFRCCPWTGSDVDITPPPPSPSYHSSSPSPPPPEDD